MTNTLPFKTLDDIGSIDGKRVVLRSELNAPQSHGVIVDATRLERALPTIHELIAKGGRVVILAHASTAQKDEQPSLKPVAEWLQNYLDVAFVDNKEIQEILKGLEENTSNVVLLQNTRQWDGEESNDPEFAQFLASLGDIYVNDAFPVAHRSHASIVGIPPLLPSYAGRQFENEYRALSKVLNPTHPFVFILGGAKFETKIPIAASFIERSDILFVGGALINALLKEKGYSVGKSFIPQDTIPGLTELAQSGKVLMPTDVIISEGNTAYKTSIDSIPSNGIISDIGPDTIRNLAEHIAHASFVVWNGPLGNVEKGFTDATSLIAEAMRRSPADTIIGGGDSLAFISNTDEIGFVSTAGGAMLEFLAKGTLPGIKALEQLI